MTTVERGNQDLLAETKTLKEAIEDALALLGGRMFKFHSDPKGRHGVKDSAERDSLLVIERLLEATIDMRTRPRDETENPPTYR